MFGYCKKKQFKKANRKSVVHAMHRFLRITLLLFQKLCKPCTGLIKKSPYTGKTIYCLSILPNLLYLFLGF